MISHHLAEPHPARHNLKVYLSVLIFVDPRVALPGFQIANRWSEKVNYVWVGGRGFTPMSASTAILLVRTILNLKQSPRVVFYNHQGAGGRLKLTSKIDYIN